MKSPMELLLGKSEFRVPPKVFGYVCVGEEISPAGWQTAPALNPKKRRGLSVFLVTRLVDEHTRAHEGLEWFGPPEHNTLLTV
jgi:hypothetical protein